MRLTVEQIRARRLENMHAALAFCEQRGLLGLDAASVLIGAAMGKLEQTFGAGDALAFFNSLTAPIVADWERQSIPSNAENDR